VVDAGIIVHDPSHVCADLVGPRTTQEVPRVLLLLAWGTFTRPESCVKVTPEMTLGYEAALHAAKIERRGKWTKARQ
jgi:hypothetical protein